MMVGAVDNRIRWCLPALLTLFCASPAQLLAADLDPVESARKSLARDKLPWYDRSKDDIRDIGLREGKPKAENRDSDWTKRKKKQADYEWDSDSNWSTAGSGSSDFWTFLQGVFWVILVLVLATVVALLVWAFMKSENKSAESAAAATQTRASHDDAARVENLPFEVRQPKSDLLSEARRHYEEGNFGEAIIYLYSYQLVQLDRFHIIQLAKGKTNRQYVRESRQRPTVRQILEGTMRAFEDVFFGHHALDREQFESCWQQLDAFHKDVQQVAS